MIGLYKMDLAPIPQTKSMSINENKLLKLKILIKKSHHSSLRSNFLSGIWFRSEFGSFAWSRSTSIGAESQSLSE